MNQCRPYTRIFSTMTVDGRIASKSGYSSLSCREDLELLHELRAWADAVLVGSRTVAIDNPRLTVRLASGASPLRVVVSSKLSVDPSSRVFDAPGRSILVTTEDWGYSDLKEYINKGVEIIKAGKGSVDLTKAFKVLREMGVRRVLVEGGGRINYSILLEGLADDLWVTVAPEVFGSGTSLLEGPGVDGIKKKIELALEDINILCGGWVNLKYIILRPKKGMC